MSEPLERVGQIASFIRQLQKGNEFLDPESFFDLLREGLYASAGAIESDGGRVRFTFYNGAKQCNELYYCDSDYEFHCESKEVRGE